jgi:hypothetical protein
MALAVIPDAQTSIHVRKVQTSYAGLDLAPHLILEYGWRQATSNQHQPKPTYHRGLRSNRRQAQHCGQVTDAMPG